MKKQRLGTRAVHGGKELKGRVHPHAVPIYQTVNFEYDDFDQKIRIEEGKESGYFYTRISNPTIDALNTTVAELEGGEESFSFASGMAAITAALLSVLKKGDHLLCTSVVYGGTYGLVTHILPDYGITCSFVDVWDLDAVDQAFRKNTRMLYIEPVMNPTLQVADLPALAALAGRHGAFTLVDNTFTPPPLFRPLLHGAGGVLHSTTKFLNGHGDTIGGIVSGPADWMEKVKTMGRMTGGTMSPFNAWLTLRGVRTLVIRMERECRNALDLALFLESHPRIRRVHYPGLSSHPQHHLARKLFSQFGAVVSFEVEGGLEAVKKVCDSFRIITSTVSLGEVDTVAAHPATSSHSRVEKAVREKYGITDGLVRLSVGIEDIEDLKEDLQQALAALK